MDTSPVMLQRLCEYVSSPALDAVWINVQSCSGGCSDSAPEAAKILHKWFLETLCVAKIARNASIYIQMHMDVGCGIGRPQMQALVQYGVSCSVGVEMDCIKCNKAVAFIERVAKDAALDASGVRILHLSSSQLTTLEPCTHLYLCWQGWHANDKAKMGALVKESASVFCVCMVQHSRDTLRDVQALVSAGWPPLQLVKSRQVHLLQSRETLRAHTYLVLGRSVGLGAPTRVRCTTGLMSVLPHKGAGEGRSLRCRKGKEEQPAAG